jgi:hypothetical protein
MKNQVGESEKAFIREWVSRGRAEEETSPILNFTQSLASQF